MSEKVIKAIVFVRVSSQGQDFENQKTTVLKNALAKYNQEEIAIIEGKESGYGLEEDKRKTLQELKAIIAENKSIESIYVWAVDRISRRCIMAINIIDELTKEGINVVILKPTRLETLDEKRNPNPIANMVMLFLAYAAELETNSIKARMNNTKTILRASGKVANGKVAYGYKKLENKSIGIDEDKAIIVRQIFNLYSTGKYSLNRLNDMLYEKDPLFFKLGYKSTTASRIKRIIGSLLYSGRNDKNTNLYPPIVSPQLQDKCIKIMEGKKTLPKHNTKTVYYAKGIIKNYSDPHHRCMIPFRNNISYRTHPSDSISYVVNINAVDSILYNSMCVLKSIAMGISNEKTIEAYKQQLKNNDETITNIDKEVNKLLDDNLRIERLLAKNRIREEVAQEQINNNDNIIKQYNVKKAEILSDNQQLLTLIEGAKQGSVSNGFFYSLYSIDDEEVIAQYIKDVIKEVRITYIDKYTKRMDIIGYPIIAHLVDRYYTITSKGGKITIMRHNMKDTTDYCDWTCIYRRRLKPL